MRAAHMGEALKMTNYKLTALKAFTGTVLAALATLLGGADIWLLTLVGFTVADYATGMIKAVITKTLNSGTAFNGGIRKILIYVIIGIAVALDRLMLPDGPILRNLAIGYYIASEGLSILENIGACGVRYPQKIAEVLASLQKNTKGNE